MERQEIQTVSSTTYSLAKTSIEAYDSQIASYRRLGRPETFDSLAEWIREANKTETRNLRIKAVKASLIEDAKRKGKDSSLVKLRIDSAFKEAGLKLGRVNKSVKKDDCISPEELKKIIRRSNSKTSIIIRSLVSTACRVSELLSMKYSDCRKVKGGIEITILGKGQKERRVYFEEKLFEEVKETFDGDFFLFDNGRGKALTRQTVHRRIRDAGQKILKIENLHPHTIRHTWATENIERLGVYKVSKYLGHADISTTARFYLHGEPEAHEILNGGLI